MIRLDRTAPDMAGDDLTCRPSSRFRSRPSASLLVRITPFIWALLDQSLVAVSNFGLNVALARWLSVGEYGAFSFIFVLLLMGLAVFGALVTEPMAILGSQQYATRFGAYTRRLLIFSLPSGALVVWLSAAVALAIVQTGTMRAAIIGFAAIAPAYLALNFLKRSAYVARRPRAAAGAASAYCVTLGIAVFALHQGGYLSAGTATVPIGAACAVAVAALCMNMKHLLDDDSSTIGRAAMLRNHMRFGRAFLPTMILSYLMVNMPFFFLPIFGSIEDVARWRALTTLILPIINVNIALSAVLGPALARSFGRARYGVLSTITLVVFEVGALLYAIALAVEPRFALHMLFSGKYDALAAEVPFIAVCPILGAATAVFAMICSTSERPGIVFRSQCVCAAVMLLCSVPMLRLFGLWGVIALVLGGEVIRGGMLYLSLRRELPQAINIRRSVRIIRRYVHSNIARRRVRQGATALAHGSPQGQ